MFTKYDKAITAVVMSILTVLSTWLASTFGLTPELVAGVVALLNPILVYAVPNKATVASTVQNTLS